MFNSNDTFYALTDNWSNNGYLDSIGDLFNGSTQRSQMSHLPLHPPNPVNGGDHAYQRSRTQNSDDHNRMISRLRNNQVHFARAVPSVPRWSVSSNRQASGNNINDYFSPSSPSFTSYSATVSNHNQSKSYSRPTVQPTPLEALKKALDLEEQKLASIRVETKRLDSKKMLCQQKIMKLKSEIEAATAAVASSSSLSQRPIILFSSLSLKYNLPPSCDLLPITTFNAVQGFRSYFKGPQALGDPSLKILLRLCSLDRQKAVQNDHINCKFEIIINDRIIYTNNKKPHRGPFDITSSCIGLRNSIEIKIITPPPGFLDEPLSKETVVHIVYAYKLETSASIAALSSDKYQRPLQSTEQLIKSKFSNECGIVDETDLKVSLTCQVRLEITVY